MVRLKLKTNSFDWLPSRFSPKARTDGESNGVGGRFSIITCLRVIQELWRPRRARISWSKNSYASTRQGSHPWRISRAGLSRVSGPRNVGMTFGRDTRNLKNLLGSPSLCDFDSGKRWVLSFDFSSVRTNFHNSFEYLENNS